MTDHPPVDDLNMVVLAGHLSSDPAERHLPSGDVLTSYEVTVPRDDGPADSVPVVLIGAVGPRGATAGDRVVVVGRVRRRFFRAGGTTASRTEVVADRFVRAGRARAVSAALDRARTLIDHLAG
jgi:single-strand DNA-binding protein